MQYASAMGVRPSNRFDRFRLGWLGCGLIGLLALGCGDSLGSKTDSETSVTQEDCIVCHEEERSSVVDPPHDSLSTSCQDCHSLEQWVPTLEAFVHSWPLDGSHARAECSSCHIGDPAVYEGTPKECIACHQDDYDSSPEPGHDAFPTSCADCHSNDAWVPALSTLDHPWPLQGAHAGASCLGCHVGDPPVYAGTPKECVGCHLADFNHSPYPGHDRFPTTCIDCHDDQRWDSATFSHAWPLKGAHAEALCLSCHLGDPPVYDGTPTACVGCHRDDYNRSPFPGHSTFSTTCTDCHGNQSWVPASFDHSWPLQGAHSQAACQSCHLGNPPKYTGTPTSCVGCHRDDYDRSPYPGHDTFPTTCQSCHTNQAWKPATAGAHPESAFPIQSGAHSRYRNDCASCHNAALGSPVGGANADCVGCHDGEHSRTEMDAKHREVRNYPSGAAPPNFCLSCHSDGRN